MYEVYTTSQINRIKTNARHATKTSLGKQQSMRIYAPSAGDKPEQVLIQQKTENSNGCIKQLVM